MDPLLIIASLERKLSELAHGSLQRPADKSLFEYGLVTGQYQGILQSINEVKRLMLGNEED